MVYGFPNDEYDTPSWLNPLSLLLNYPSAHVKKRKSMLLYFGIVVIGFAILVWSADLFVDGAAAIAKSAGMSKLLIGMTIVSIGTSAPEILVSLIASATGAGTLAIGNAFGSNITNIGLVLGVTLLIAPIRVGRTTAFKDLPMLVGTVALCGVLLWDRTLSLVDAAILLSGLLLFLRRMYSHSKHPDINDEPVELDEFPLNKAWPRFIAGLVLLILSSRALVWASVNIAATFGVSELVIGLTIVAIGTSLPELAASLMSALRGHADIAIGAVVGSNMFNLLVVLSLPGFFAPLSLEAAAVERDLLLVALTTVSLAIMTWIRWSRPTQNARLGRSAGALFLLLYAGHVTWLLQSV